MIDGRIKFRHLQCFLAVAQQRSLQKAAATLSITPPAVSKTIRELEEIMQVRLFDRGRKGAVLTRRAEPFFKHAEESVNALQQAANSIGQAWDSAPAVIRIGAAPALTASFVPQALLTFHQHVPNIQVSVLTGTTSHLMAQLREREFDFILCRHCDPEQMLGLAFEYLYADPLVVVVRPGHPLLKTPGAKANELRPFTAILPIKSSINRPAAESFATRLGIGPLSDFIESLSISFGRTYTINSDAIWFVPWSAVQHDVETEALVKLSRPMKAGDESTGLMARSIGLMMRSNTVLTSETQILINAIRECALERRTDLF